MPPRRKQVTYSQRPNHAARIAHARGEREFRTYDTSYIRPKHSRVPIVIAAVLAVLVIGGLIWGSLTLMKGCSEQPSLLAQGQTVQIEVAEGSGAQAIGRQLEQAGLIGSSSEFVSRVNELGVDSQLKPGVYEFTGGMSIDEVIRSLQAGPLASGISLTIPEGSTLAQTAQLVNEVTEGRVTADAFTAAAADASVYVADFPFLADAGQASLEGFLFPKTYPIADDATADAIIRLMLGQYQTETAGLDYSYAASQGLSSYDVLKLASIVEKESNAEHRATVASVFYNRLALGMRLQSDATTAYEVGRDPSAEDIATAGPYNTYTNDGLPPTPINSPGIECLKAVCAPGQTNYYYFYFETDDSGTLQYSFSETYEEHRATYE